MKILAFNDPSESKWKRLLIGLCLLALAMAMVLAFLNLRWFESAEDILLNADALQASGQTRSAIALLDGGLSGHPEASRQIHERLGGILQGTGQTAKSAHHLDVAMRLGGGEAVIKRLIRARISSIKMSRLWP